MYELIDEQLEFVVGGSGSFNGNLGIGSGNYDGNGNYSDNGSNNDSGNLSGNTVGSYNTTLQKGSFHNVAVQSFNANSNSVILVQF